jgi:DNA repair protein SbcD/Mre11
VGLGDRWRGTAIAPLGVEPEQKVDYARGVKLFHAADIHLDSPLRGLDRYDGAPTERLRGATRAALGRLIDACIDEGVDALLIAGDLFDGAWKDYSTGLFFVTAMGRLKAAGIPVIVVRGNHDAESIVARKLPALDHVRVLSSRKPESVELADGAIVVHGMSFGSKAVSDDIASRYPDARPGVINVGVLHTSLDGREGHEPYAPTSLDVLRSKGYAYWALGHVHAREIVSRDPWVVFPGNLQGRHARETGDKGATLVTFSASGVASVEHRSMDVVRWSRVEVDAAGAGSVDDVLDRVRSAIAEAAEAADGLLLAARVTIVGATEVSGALHADAELPGRVRLVAADAAGIDAWVEKVEVRTRTSADLDALRTQDSALGQLARRLAETRTDDAALTELASCFADLTKKLPADARAGADGFDPTDLSTMRELYMHVEETLLGALTGGADDE